MEKIYVKNEHLFKNKIQMIIYLLIFALLIYLFIYFGTKDYNTEIPDNERFAVEFSMVDEYNVFKYATASSVRMIAAGSDGIVLFGTNNEWVNYYAYIVNYAAKKVGIGEIYYYDFLKNRLDNNGTYEDIVNKLSDYVSYNDRGIAEIYAPTLLVVKNGKVIYFDSETSFVKGQTSPAEYWNSFNEQQKISELEEIFLEYLGS